MKSFLVGGDKHNCCGCTACESVCPANCIKMVSDCEGFVYPIIENASCLQCDLCNSVCPFNKTVVVKKSLPIAYASFNNNQNVRLQSASGGIFSVLAEWVIKKNGVVYGCAFKPNYRECSHIRVDSIDDIKYLRSSKYIQSSISGVFVRVKNDLKDNRVVLFSGTPCQIDGLQSFLGKKYESLILVEVVCHGVPSKLLLDKYLNFLEKKYRGTVSFLNFRQKFFKNNNSIRGCNNAIELKELPNTNLFYSLFLKNICLRYSCYNCPSKNGSSAADITIGDFWGIKDILPDFDDDKGVSLVLSHNDKSEKILKSIGPFIHLEQIDYYKAISRNTSYSKSAVEKDLRKNFYDDLIKAKTIKKIKKKYCQKTIRERFLSFPFVKKIISIIKRKKKSHSMSQGVYIVIKKEE